MIKEIKNILVGRRKEVVQDRILEVQPSLSHHEIYWHISLVLKASCHLD